ncbi:MAG: RNA polymerase sigma factor [Ruminococcus sp.]|nr:RNA polymerase sigma factor [Ruminococcus sp.]
MDNGASSYRRFRDNGDESGLVEIIRDYKDGLILYLTSIVGNIHTAEELAEDTFVLLGTKKPRDKGGGSFKTWLYTIGRNIAIDYLRKYRKRTFVTLEDSAELVSEEEEVESLYLRKEQQITVHRAMRRLSPEHQQVLWLVYFEELSNKEAARVMRRSVRSVESLLYRARKSLKAQLEMEGFDYEKL